MKFGDVIRGSNERDSHNENYVKVRVDINGMGRMFSMELIIIVHVSVILKLMVVRNFTMKWDLSHKSAYLFYKQYVKRVGFWVSIQRFPNNLLM